MRDLDDPLLRAAMAAYVRLADQLDATAALGSEARNLLDQAEAKAMAGLALRRQLVELGWTQPEVSRTSYGRMSAQQ